MCYQKQCRYRRPYYPLPLYIFLSHTLLTSDPTKCLVSCLHVARYNISNQSKNRQQKRYQPNNSSSCFLCGRIIFVETHRILWTMYDYIQWLSSQLCTHPYRGMIPNSVSIPRCDLFSILARFHLSLVSSRADPKAIEWKDIKEKCDVSIMPITNGFLFICFSSLCYTPSGGRFGSPLGLHGFDYIIDWN